MRLGPGLLYEGRTLQGARPKLADFCSATMAEFYSAVDRLDRARSFIDWDKARVFRQDLKGLCDSIIKELAPADVRNRNNSNAARQSIFATRACGA
jgi:hypothetical protein